jgi:putative SOS response-associated peptidase YedK
MPAQKPHWAAPHWRRWLAVGNRCVVPFNSFLENAPITFEPVWFALHESRPLAFFAGIWTSWTSVRKVKEGETTNDIFAFLKRLATASDDTVETLADVFENLRGRALALVDADVAKREDFPEIK